VQFNNGRRQHIPNPQMETSPMQVQLKVNGKAASVDVAPNTLLVQVLRENLKLTGTHVGCDTANAAPARCIVNGRAVKSCNVLAVQSTAPRSPPSKAWPSPTAPCTRCRPPSRSATACSAASARPAW
jgi:hypothetical protein